MYEGFKKPMTGEKVIIDSLRTRTGKSLITGPEVYSAYYEQLKNQHDKKWWTRLSAEKTGIDIQYEDAVRANLDFDARQSEEFEKWQENLRLVFTEMDQYAKGDRSVRPMLIVLGGAMKGIHCAAQLLAFEELNLRHSFAAIGGVSAGSGPMAYFATGQTQKSIRLFTEQCTTKEFLDYKRGTGALDTRVIGRHMRAAGDYQLDIDLLQQSEAALFALATGRDGEVDLLDLKTSTHGGLIDPTAVCEGSSAIPLFDPAGREINGKFYMDGSVGRFPMSKIVAKHGPTSMLILPNLSFREQAETEQSTVEKMVLNLVTMFGQQGSLGSVATNFINDMGQTLRIDNKRSLTELKTFIANKENERLVLETIAKETGIKIGVLYPPSSRVGNLTNDPHIFAAAKLSTYEDTHQQLRKLGVALPQST